MPPTIVQANSGSGGTGTATVTVSLTNPATAGNAIVVSYSCGVPISTRPAEFNDDFIAGGAFYMYWWRIDAAVGGEQSWNVTNNTSNLPTLWRVWEVSPIDTISSVTASAGTDYFHPPTSTMTLSTGTTAASDTDDVLVLALHVFANSSFAGTTATWSGHTNGFTEDAEIAISIGAAYYDASYSSVAPASTGPYECTATLSADVRNAANDSFTASIVAYRPFGQVVVDPNVMVSGG